MRTGMEDRLTDRRGEGGNGERRNVKAGALEVILAGNLSYHSDLVKALQQVRGERGRQRERESRGLCLIALVFLGTILNMAAYLMTVCI